LSRLLCTIDCCNHGYYLAHALIKLVTNIHKQTNPIPPITPRFYLASGLMPINIHKQQTVSLDMQRASNMHVNSIHPLPQRSRKIHGRRTKIPIIKRFSPVYPWESYLRRGIVVVLWLLSLLLLLLSAKSRTGR
jgi:hypothetical protein